MWASDPLFDQLVREVWDVGTPDVAYTNFSSIWGAEGKGGKGQTRT